MTLLRLWHWIQRNHDWNFDGEDGPYDLISCRCGAKAKVPGP